MLRFITSIGNQTYQAVLQTGALSLFLQKAFTSLKEKGLDFKKTLYHAVAIGIDSLPIIVITGASVGSVLAWQTYIGLKRFHAFEYIGPVVFLGMVREFGPVLSAIMITGRAGSAMTAEIGTMRISEQLDALQTLGINVERYLIVPRLIATTFVLPLASLFCSLCGIIGGYLIVVLTLKVNHEMYMESIRQNVVIGDIFHGMIKAVVFGFLISLIATYKGYTTQGGAKGVGKATTQSVVAACLSILVTDYLMTSLMAGS